VTGGVRGRSAWLRSHREAILLALVVCGLFSLTLFHQLVWDDRSIVPRVERAWAEGGFPRLLGLNYSAFEAWEKEGEVLYWRPVTVLSLWLDGRFATHGFPFSFHATNILLHAGATLLLFRILSRFLLSRNSAFLASLLFAVHPAQVDAVSFVSNRSTMWACVFVLLAVHAWLSAREDRAGGRGCLFLGGGAALFFACLSKEVAFVLPLVLLAWDLVAGGLRDGQGRSWWRRNLAWLGVWGGALSLSILLRAAALGPGLPGAPLAGAGGGALSLLFSPAWWSTLFGLFFFPFPLSLWYPAESLRVSWQGVAGGVLLLVLFISLAGRRSGRAGTLALLWVIVFLLPSAGVAASGGSPVRETYLYLPLAGFALLLGAGIDRLGKGSPGAGRLLTLLCLSVVLASTLASVKRMQVWKDDESVFRAIIAERPGISLGYLNLGTRLARSGRAEEGIPLIARAVELESGPWPLLALGNALLDAGRRPEAIEAYQRMLQAIAGSPGAERGRIAERRIFAWGLWMTGKVGEAEREMESLALASPDAARSLRSMLSRQQRGSDAPGQEATP
jgi:protein O-mannosyl-transferase